MTDAAYTFKQTEIERKRSGRGAYAKKGGSRSKKCSLPSDKLTAKQRKELNSKVETYNLSRPMNWIQFLYMPKDLQKKYIQDCINLHNARRLDLAEMFGVAPNTLSAFLKNKMDGWTPWDGKASLHSPSPKWLAFVAPDEPEVAEVSQPAEEDIVQPAASESVKQPVLTEVSSDVKMVRLEIQSGRLKFTGWPRAIFEKALLAMDPSDTYKIEIYFEKEVE